MRGMRALGFQVVAGGLAATCLQGLMAEGSELERRVGSPAMLAYVGSIGALSQALYGEQGRHGGGGDLGLQEASALIGLAWPGGRVALPWDLSDCLCPCPCPDAPQCSGGDLGGGAAVQQPAAHDAVLPRLRHWVLRHRLWAAGREQWACLHGAWWLGAARH